MCVSDFYIEMDKKIKIAHITTVDLSLRYLLLNQLRYLKQEGYEVIGISSPGEELQYIQNAGIRHIAVPMTRRAFTPLADLYALWSFIKVFRKEQPVIVHTHTLKAGIFGRWAAKLARVPVIVHTSHGFIFHEGSSWLWRSFFVLLEKLAARCSDLIFSVNHEDIETAVRQGICDHKKIVPLGKGGIGINLSLFDPCSLSSDDIVRKRRETGLPDGVRVVGFVGRLVREKGLLELFEAARIVRERVNEEVRFLIIGPLDSTKPDALNYEVARDYGISEICIFTGMRQDMPELYALMDVFVLPSHREGLPRAPMEASAMGVPCVVTDIRGCREAVEHSRNGLVVPLGDVQALANAIMELLTDPEKARRMGEEGRRMALERFDERLVFEKVKVEYARLLEEKGYRVPEPLGP
jgi:glycosyltransferase involved in cell wall biosynthesis